MLGLRLPKLALSASAEQVACFRHLCSETAKPAVNKSATSRFKETPIRPAILDYIQRIGVGIPPRSRSSKHLSQQRPLRKNTQPTKTPLSLQKKPNATPRSSVWKSLKKEWAPPPPFGPKSRPVSVLSTFGLEYSGLASLPTNPEGFPEIACIGRSNVGKSTLVNALLYGNQDYVVNEKPPGRSRKRMITNSKLPKGVKATVSDRPGETKAITFYELSSAAEAGYCKLVLVDLPGYGFAFAKPEDANGYRRMILSYLLLRGKRLKRVLLLIDARHGLKRADIEFLQSLQSEALSLQIDTTSPKVQTSVPSIQVCLTKCDLVTQSDLARRATQVKEQMSQILQREPNKLPIMLVSAKAGIGFNNIQGDRAQGGILELQRELASLAKIIQDRS